MPPEGFPSTMRALLVTIANVRSVTGYSATRDVADADVQHLIERAQAQVLNDLSRRVEGIAMEGERNGTNATYRLPPLFPPSNTRPVIVDDTLNNATDTGDVTIYSRTDPSGSGVPTWATLAVTNVDGLRGIVVLTSAPASTVDAVEFSGRTMHRSIDRDQVKNLVQWYAAYLVDLRVRQPGKVILADPGHAGKTVAVAGRDWLKLYEAELAPARAPPPRAASIDLSLPGRARRGTL